MRLASFPFHLSKVLRPPRNRNARSYKVLHLSRKIIFPKLKTWCSKMQPLSRNQRPDLLTSLMNMSLVLRLPHKMSHACHRFWKCYKTLTFCSLLAECTIPCACYAKRHLNVQKCSEPVSFLHFWLRNVLRATTACNGSSLIWPHVRTRRFSEPTFRPSGATNHWKKTIKPRLSTFSRTCIFFLLTLSLLWSSLFFSLLFSYLTLPTSAFPSVHIVGSLTSKLSSTMICHDLSLFPILSCYPMPSSGCTPSTIVPARGPAASCRSTSSAAKRSSRCPFTWDLRSEAMPLIWRFNSQKSWYNEK